MFNLFYSISYWLKKIAACTTALNLLLAPKLVDFNNTEL